MPPLIYPFPEQSTACLEPRVFLPMLEKELLRAERYNHYVSVLLLQLEELEIGTLQSSCERLASGLVDLVRRSDYVGALGDDTLGVILLHASDESARIVLERLRSESTLLVNPQNAYLRGSCATFPSHANSLKSLLGLAFSRLTQ